ncbi:MAG: putative quinol monooxygenase [Bacillota bacterium]|nr:putative quinol monooxygenase [Negativicutes bacterium]
MYTIMAKLTARKGQEQRLVEALAGLAKASREEAGCITYIPHVVANNPAEIVIFEQYVDEAALQVHAQSPHFKAVFDTRKDELLGGPLEITVLHEF